MQTAQESKWCLKHAVTSGRAWQNTRERASSTWQSLAQGLVPDGKDKRDLSLTLSQKNLFPLACSVVPGAGQIPETRSCTWTNCIHCDQLPGQSIQPQFLWEHQRCCSLTPSHCQTAASHPAELLRKTHFPRCPKKWLNHFWFVFFLECKQNIPLGQTGIQQQANPTQPYRNTRKRSKLEAPGYKLKGRGRNTTYLQGRSCWSSHQDKELLITLPTPPVPGNIKCLLTWISAPCGETHPKISRVVSTASRRQQAELKCSHCCSLWISTARR